MNERTNPFEELERLFDRMSRQFGEASTRWGGIEPFQGTSPLESMAVDLVEHDEEFVVSVDLPGYERDDVDIQVTNHTLRIDAEREAAVDEAEENYIRRERRHESMQRSIQLPDEVDAENVAATMKNGVLTITMPKLEGEAARQIEIE